MNYKPTLTAFALVATSVTLSSQTFLYVDFQHDTGADATGYTIASSGQPSLTSFANPAPINLGSGYSLSFLGNYLTFDGGSFSSNPVDEDGWLLQDPLGTFTLSGLTAGDEVTMYATNAWDDFGVFNSIVSQISFGGGGLVDVLAGNFPGTNGGSDTDPNNTNDLFGDSQNTDFFTTIASTVVATGPSLTGTIDTSASPGQFGAFIFEVTPIPETSSFALLAGFLALGSIMIRRRR